jgi:multiple sugar transport system permease protein
MNKIQSLAGNLVLYVAVLIILIFTLFPIWWIVNISLKTREEALVVPPQIIFRPTLKNYQEVIFGVKREDNEGRWVPTTRDFMKQVQNSVIISFSATAIALLAGIPAAYALSKFRFKKKKQISFFILSTRFLPPIVVVIPLFVAFRELRLMDTKLGMIILYTFVSLSLVIWMMKGFFDEIPYELIESARVDGCGHFGAMLRIGVPVTMQGIAATSILVLINLWNEFLFAVLFTSKNARPVTMAVMGYVTVREVAWSNMAAAGILITIPVLVFTIITQKRLVQGLTAGAVKG